MEDLAVGLSSMNAVNHARVEKRIERVLVPTPLHRMMGEIAVAWAQVTKKKIVILMSFVQVCKYY